MQLTIRTDGGSRGNPGPAAAGIIICDAKGKLLYARGFFLGNTTNNVAEYEGIVRGLEEAEKLGGSEIKLFSDSELLVKQINGQYRVKSEQLKPYYQQVMEQIRKFKKVTVRHVRRSENAKADELVNGALDRGADYDGVSSKSKKDSPVGNKKYQKKKQEKVLLGKVDLLKKAQSGPKGAYKETLSKKEGFVSQIIRLEAGEETRTEGEWEQTTVTVLAGRGTIEAAGNKESLYEGLWVQLGSVKEMHFSAHAGEPLVLLITGSR